MIITSSAVGMAANSAKKVTYQQTKQSFMSNPVTGEKRYSKSEFITTYERNISGNSLGEGNMISNSPKGITPNVGLREKDSVQDLLRQIRNFMMEFRNRLTLMLGKRDNSERQRIFGGNELVDISSAVGATNIWNIVNYESYTYKEEENMTFETVGKVITKDGRSLEFNLQVEMTREFQETTECLTKETGVIMTDPLVISLNSNPVGVSDQKWQFDIDGDGEKDNISLLSKGCGFLAFDKNEDGVINDGLELFGAKTGNGFAELLEFDKDGNGWIDEQDEVYNKLNVWIKDDGGQDKLINLKEANVGAIYLGSQRTEFSLMSEDGRDQNAQLRRSGVYLSEDGMARSIQQLDMVTALCS